MLTVEDLPMRHREPFDGNLQFLRGLVEQKRLETSRRFDSGISGHQSDAARIASEIDGREAVVAAHREGRGLVLAIAHLGNWEVAAPVAASLGFPIISVAEELSNRRITDWFIETRAG